jgi:hypothetical protein
MTPENSEDPRVKDPHWNPIRNIILPDAKRQPDRSLAIVLGSVVEAQLGDLIVNRLVDNKKIADKLFTGLGPLNNFAGKIDLGFLLGLYGKETASMLHAIRGIRNLFAHEMLPLNFESPIIVKKAQPLTFINQFGRGKPRAGRPLYIGACEFVLGGLFAVASDRRRFKSPVPGKAPSGTIE